jgi:hypothetical protein
MQQDMLFFADSEYICNSMSSENKDVPLLMIVELFCGLDLLLKIVYNLSLIY